MTNDNRIIEYIKKSVSLTDEEAETFAAGFKEVKIKKRQFIVQPNFIAKHRNYVLNGASGHMLLMIVEMTIPLHLPLTIGG